MLLNFCLPALLALFGGAGDSLITYPEYPAVIERDDAYQVSVTQGEVTKPLVVYNHCEKSILSHRIHGGDVNRRFCEFAFSGAPVRVDIQVRQDVSAYKVFPARLRFRHEFKNGVISVWLEKPEYFGIQLNDDNNSILSVLADEPEDPALIPDKKDPGVLYVEKWLDAPERDGNLITDEKIHQIYIAPGAVLNARLKIRGKGTLVNGRGLILDPMSNIFRYDQQKNREFGVLSIQAPDVTLRDVKLCDARTFNYIVGRDNARLINVKAFSSMMCTDGISFFGGKNVLVDHAWLYVGDNALVLSGSCPLTVKNVVIGTSCKAIFPQGSFKTVDLENIDIFRADEGVIQNLYNGETRPATKQQTTSVRFRNLSAVDSTYISCLFAGFDMGELPKPYWFENCSIPEPTGAALYWTIGRKGPVLLVKNGPKYLFTNNYTLDFVNLFIAGQPVNALPDDRFVGREHMTVSFRQQDLSDYLPMAADRVEVSYTYKRKKAPKPVHAGTNLVRERFEIRSVWQRHPSYMAKLETFIEPDGNVIYSVSKTQDSGMQCIMTDEFLRSGNGTYTLEFEAKCAEGEALLNMKLLSNEKDVTKSVKLTTEWQKFTVEFQTDFDLDVTKLVSLYFQFPEECENALIKNVSFVKK